MPKKVKKTNSNCEQHQFILKPKQTYCRFAQTVSISFCDQVKDRKKSKVKKCRNNPCLDCPIFNKDKNFATPTFILTSEKNYYQERGEKMRDQHEKKMIEFTDEKDSLNIPKPRTKNNFCSVCRQVYEDYLQHIQSQRHKKKINTSHFNRYILDIAQKFNPNSKNFFNYSNHTLSTRIQDQVEIIQNKPKKKIKLDNDNSQKLSAYQQGIKQHVPPPPPHLDLNHTGYFPPFHRDLNPFTTQINPLSLNQAINPPMTFNYNMNIFMNPYNYPYYQSSYNIFNPLIQYRQNPMLNPMQYPGMEQNYFMHQNMKQISGKGLIPFHNMSYNREQKREIIVRSKSQIIVIDDQDDNYPDQNYDKNE